MDFRYTPEEEAFRQEFRAWLAPHLHAHRAQWGEDEDEFTSTRAARPAWPGISVSTTAAGSAYNGQKNMVGAARRRCSR